MSANRILAFSARKTHPEVLLQHKVANPDQDDSARALTTGVDDAKRVLKELTQVFRLRRPLAAPNKCSIGLMFTEMKINTCAMRSLEVMSSHLPCRLGHPASEGLQDGNVPFREVDRVEDVSDERTAKSSVTM